MKNINFYIYFLVGNLEFEFSSRTIREFISHLIANKYSKSASASRIIVNSQV